MSNFKTKNGENLNSFTGELRLLAEKKGQKQKVELWLLNDITNRNNWRYENLEAHRALFAGTPILVAYVGDKVGDGHNFDMVRTDNGEEYASFLSATAERIVGYFESESDIRIEEKDGKKWVVGQGWIWKWYAQELVAKVKKQGLDGMPISIETLIDDGYMEGDTEVFTKYQILGTTILGLDVLPAVKSANIRALSAIGIEAIREQTLRVASMQEQNQNPQTKNNKEKQTIMNKKWLKDNFKGVKIVGIVGDKVALLSCDKNEAHVSSAVKDNGEIVEGVKTAVNATVVFGEGENEIKVALDSVIETFVKENEELKAKIATNQNTIEELSKTNEKMKAQETERRKEAVKTAIESRFAEIKANSDVEFANDECDELKAEEKVNEFIAMVDKDDKFIGDKEAIKAVDARCMSKIIETNKVKANSAKRVYAWSENAQEGEHGKSVDEVDATVAEFGGKQN